MLTTITNNSPKQINTSLFSLQQQIDLLLKSVNKQTEQIKKLEARINELESH